jgi:hypothetical protein
LLHETPLFHTANKFCGNAHHSVNRDQMDFIYHIACEELKEKNDTILWEFKTSRSLLIPEYVCWHFFLSPRQANFIEFEDLLCYVVLGCVLEML